MAKTPRQLGTPTRSRRARAAVGPLARAAAATTACILWVGLALPGLQLLPGSGGFGDRGIAISLQSALLGIDDGYASTPAARAAMRALGLSVIQQAASVAASDDDDVSLAVDLDDGVRTDAVETTLVAVRPYEPAGASSDTGGPGPDAPDRSSPQHPAAPAAPTDPSPPPAGGGGVSKPPALPAAKTAQSITFTTSPPAAVVGGSYSVGASASSGLPVSFSLAPSSSGVCTISGANVGFVGSGTCTIRANQAGNGSYLPAPQLTQSFDVELAIAVQTISFVSIPPSGARVGDAPYVVTAKATSGLPVELGTESNSAGICKVTGVKVHLTGEGTCTINATQMGNSKFLPAPPALQSFSIGADAPSKSIQSINFTSTPPSGAAIGGTYVVSATASSGLAVAYTIAPSSSGVCSASGSTVSLFGQGTCTVRANQPGNASYLAAPQVQQTFLVGHVGQTITFASTPPSGAAVGGPDYAVAATASSGLAVVFSANPSSAGVCTVSGSTVSLTGAGTCTIDADQAGDATHGPAPQVQQSFTIGGPSAPSVQSISFTSAAPGGAGTGGPTYTVTASASSGLAVAFSSGSVSVCRVSGSTVSFLAPGTCTVLANQAGNGSYSAAPQVSQSFAVGKGAQTISFTTPSPSGAYVGGPTYNVGANASSGLPVAFSSGSPSVCSVSGSTVTFTASGTCIVRANQSGNANYQPAPQVQQSFTVVPAPAPQAITFTSNAPSSAVYLGSSYNVSATASSGLPVAFTASGSCTISGSTVAMAGAGTCTVYGNQSGSSAYLAAPQVQQTFSIAKRSQTITFPDPGNFDKDDPPFPLSATSSSGLAVIYTLDPSSASTCSLSGNVVTPLERGDCIVHANQPGNANYLAAAEVTRVIKLKNHIPG